jgi:aminoglycoside phosphotransferase (APT) family kinase protein
LSPANDLEQPVDAGLAAWIDQLVGGRGKDWTRLVSGNSRTTWAIDAEVANGSLPLVVRVDEGDGPYSGTPLTLAREAVAYRALDGRGLAIPRFHGYSEELQALAMSRVEGEPLWDDRVLAGVLAEAAKLHAIEVDDLDLPGFGRSARSELDLWAGIATSRVSPASPFADFAIEFLRRRFPGEPDRLVFVHGDLGTGNALWHDGRVSALLDWELSHLGDPHDDLAFLSVRTALHGLELDDFSAAVRTNYASITGLALDPDRLRYWQAVGILRNLLTCLGSISNPVAGRDRLVHFMLIPPLQRLLVGQLAEIAAVDLPEPEDLGPPPALPGAGLISEIGRELADLPDAIADPERRQRVRRMRYLFGQLAETWPLAAEIARRDDAEAPGADDEGRLRQLARVADRELALFPRARPLAYARLATL